MRWAICFWLIMLLLALAWLAAIVPLGGAPSGQMTQWRRTADGWQRATWLATTESRRPALHPLSVAILELLLIAFGTQTLSCRGPANPPSPPPRDGHI